jgi:hypothetical protein
MKVAPNTHRLAVADDRDAVQDGEDAEHGKSNRKGWDVLEAWVLNYVRCEFTWQHRA